ncbi:MerR family transcriptional regulator [Bacillus infantis]|uniref:MerR family transcriptional regulator n=1 Tax=Bacillus infantis TaxID=324767 RepID=UPI0021552077|nr:MerR family transcriptional regulator [Bacillus infantis]MCR6609198.1 MerR family transcriptional regulator [Bacillus infantis]
MAMKVKEAAGLAGISVRTLHHYDEIGLLVPDELSEAGYRLYSDENLQTLQQILFFKELGFPLKKIKDIISSPSFDQQKAFELHREMLLEKRSRLDKMIASLDKTIRHAKGEIHMSNKERFEGFDFSSSPYEQEARERWGDKAVDASNNKIAKMTKEEQQKLGDSMNGIYRRLAEVRHMAPDSDAAQEAIGEWFIFLNKMGSYSLDAFKGLGQMYVDDERFTRNIDQFGDGLARFMRDSMAVYADKNK